MLKFYEHYYKHKLMLYIPCFKNIIHSNKLPKYCVLKFLFY